MGFLFKYFRPQTLGFFPAWRKKISQYLFTKPNVMLLGEVPINHSRKKCSEKIQNEIKIAGMDEMHFILPFCW
jgi:hypothetical protein